MANDMTIMKYLEAGIRAEGTKQSAIANNLANLNTPGYRRFEVKFEDALSKAMDTGKDKDLQNATPELFKPLNTAINDRGNDVNLNLEIGNMVKNTLQHKTYTLLLKKKYSQYEMAMRGV
jgi:flagellar basal-body rod protein FlgB